MKRGNNVFVEIVSFKNVLKALKDAGARNIRNFPAYKSVFLQDRKHFYKSLPSPFGKQRMVMKPRISMTEEIMSFYEKTKQKNKVQK